MATQKKNTILPYRIEKTYRYYGTGLKLGDCGLTIMKATHNDTGTWSCHMGSAHVTVIDRVKEINVRIAGNDGIPK